MASLLFSGGCTPGGAPPGEAPLSVASPAPSDNPEASSEPTPPASATPGVPEAPDDEEPESSRYLKSLYPHDLTFPDGTTVGPGGTVPVFWHFEGVFFQTLLFRDLSADGVSSLTRALGEGRFDDTPLLVAPDGSLLIQGNAEELSSSLAADDLGFQANPSFGALYYDGKAGLRILSEKGSAPEGWACIGQALTPADFWERIAEADLPQSGAVDIGLPRIERLAIPAT